MLAVFYVIFFFFFCLVCFVSALFSRCWRPKIGKIFTSCLYVNNNNTEKRFHDCPSVCTTANCFKKKSNWLFLLYFSFIFPLNQTTLIRVACPCHSKGSFRCQTKTFSCTSIHSHCSRYEDVDVSFSFISETSTKR